MVSRENSLISSLESGLRCTREGRHMEAASFFALARECLHAEQPSFALVLDEIIQGYTAYLQAQEALLQACKHFTRIDMEQQARLATLESLLATRTQAVLQDVEPMQEQATRSQFLDRERHYITPVEQASILPALSITCFGQFEVWRLGKQVSLCSSRNGQAILRYLVAQPGHCASIDKVMSLFWPEDEPEVAQRKLHLAISALRRSLNQDCTSEPGAGYILCKNRIYSLNKAVTIQTDVDEFLSYYRRGQQRSEERVALYEQACHLYTGPFLLEDRYADWSFLQREQLSHAYLTMCHVITKHYVQKQWHQESTKWLQATLKESPYDELAHRQLIQVYMAQGYRSAALQQYQRCEHLLREELGVVPMPETTQILQQILTDQVSPH